VLEIQDDTLDAARFEAMVRAAGIEPDLGSRLRLLDGAVGPMLARGPALEEFSWPWAVAGARPASIGAGSTDALQPGRRPPGAR
jgi:hypothetical protein